MKVYVHRTSKRVIKITPQADGSVMVLAHRFVSQKRIAQVLLENATWIKAKTKELSESFQQDNFADTVGTPEVISVDNFTNEMIADVFSFKKILVCGQLYDVASSARSQTSLQGNCVYVCEKHFANRIERSRSLKNFLKRMCDGVVASLIATFGKNTRLCPSKIQFKDLRGKWCDCNEAEKGGVVLDFRLIQLPKDLQNYVIAHCFAHFDCAGHDEQFWNHLSNYLPNYGNCQKWLKEYAFLLEVF